MKIVVGLLVINAAIHWAMLRKLGTRQNELDKRIIVATAFAQVARDIARKVDGRK